MPSAVLAETETAVFAGGCFWCLEHDLEDLPGVVEATSGYSGGQLDNPTYRQVSSETTGHQEVVEVRFDPARIAYSTLLRSYWRNVDPLDGGGQFCDRGDSYRPVIFTRMQPRPMRLKRVRRRLLWSGPAPFSLGGTAGCRPVLASGGIPELRENNALKYNYTIELRTGSTT